MGGHGKKNKYSRVVKLIVDPSSPTGMTEALSTRWTGLDMEVPKGCNIVVVYDNKLSGHQSARGHLRIAHFRDEHYNRRIRASLPALTSADNMEDEMPANVIYCVFDGGAHGNEYKFNKPSTNCRGKALEKDERTLFLQTTEKPLREHRGNYSGAYGLPTMKSALRHSSGGGAVPDKKVFSGGSNRDPVI